MPVTVKKRSLEKYTPSDSATAKGVVAIRKSKMFRAQRVQKTFGGDEYTRREAATDTTMTKALRDVKAEQRTPAPLNEDVKMAIRKKSKK